MVRRALGIFKASGKVPRRQTPEESGALQPTIPEATTAGGCGRLFRFTERGRNFRYGAPLPHWGLCDGPEQIAYWGQNRLLEDSSMEELEVPSEALIICSRYTTTAKLSGELRFRSSVGSRGTATKIASQIYSFETRFVLRARLFHESSKK